MPVIPDPTPDWLKWLRPENASVTDSTTTQAIRTIAHWIGVDDPTKQALSIAAPMEAGESGGLAGLIGKFIKAYHGSPHDFERFDISKVGTGEGAQAFGHGLYFAENPQVAQSYAETLRKNVPVDPATLQEYFTPGRVVPGYGGPDRVIEFRPPTDQSDWAVKVQRVDANGKAVEPPRWHATQPLRHDVEQVLGRTRQGMYEVAIHADPEHFLDWHKLLAEQPNVEAKVRPLVGPVPRPDLVKGSSAYKSIGIRLAEQSPTETSTALQVSDALRKTGIPGIKYFDQGSRSTSEGTRNYVVFDDKIVEILKKYGVLLPAAAGGYQFAPPLGDKP